MKAEQADEESLLKHIDLPGIQEWSKEDQEAARLLIKVVSCMFATNDFDLGRTTVLKHKIKLTGYTSFEEHYRCIPTGIYEEVRAHL